MSYSFGSFQQALLRMQREPIEEDIRILRSIVKRLYHRRPRRIARRLQRFHSTIYRDPLDVVARYLRRHTQGPWHRGGSHIARFHGGPGIGFRGFRNDRRHKLIPILLNA